MNVKFKLKVFVQAIVLSLLLTGCGQPQSKNFQMPLEDAVQIAAAGDCLLSIQDYTELIEKTGDGLMVVDLRSSADYDKGHLPEAINIPAANLLDDEQFSLLENSKTLVLYDQDAFQASGPAMLLTQLGLKSVKILESGYQGFFNATEAPELERALYDYAVVFQKAVDQHQKELKAGTRPVIVKSPVNPKKTITPKPKPKKKKVAEEEGC